MNEVIKLTYYAKITKEKDGYIVRFRDFDNVLAEGDTFEEATFNAQEALDAVLMAMVEKDIEIPFPTSARKNEYAIPVSPEIAAPILLHVLRTKRGCTMAQVAKAINVPYQQYQRLEHNCNMTLKSLKRAAKAMGGRVELSLCVD